MRRARVEQVQSGSMVDGRLFQLGMRRLPYKEADGIPSKGVWSIVSALANKS